MSHQKSAAEIEHTTRQLFTDELSSLHFPPHGDAVAVFKPVMGEANEEYRQALSEKLDTVFGRSRVSVGNALGDGKGLEVIIKRGSGVRAKLGEVMERDHDVSR